MFLFKINLITRSNNYFMKTSFRLISLIFIILFISISFNILQSQTLGSKPDPIIFAYGGGLNKTFITYVASLTGKSNPSICYIPTASADSDQGIIRWYEMAKDLPIRPSVLRTFVTSYDDKESFENIIMRMDAIIVGGGNTLNMMAIWKAQGIDTVIKNAYKKGIVMAGGSAGSLCWFESGTTDSRPINLSIVECLGILPYSHCPHYHSEKSRQPLYFDNILNGHLSSGYAIDDQAGIVFKNGVVDHVVRMNEENNAYFVHLKNGKIVEDKLPGKIIENVK